MGLTNNDILKKLRVAHKLTDVHIVAICKLVDFEVSKSELGAMFRSEDHEKYMEAGDQILRNFLNGLIIHLRGPMPDKRLKASAETDKSKMIASMKKKDNTRSDRANNKRSDRHIPKKSAGRSDKPKKIKFTRKKG